MTNKLFKTSFNFFLFFVFPSGIWSGFPPWD